MRPAGRARQDAPRPGRGAWDAVLARQEPGGRPPRLEVAQRPRGQRRHHEDLRFWLGAHQEHDRRHAGVHGARATERGHVLRRRRRLRVWHHAVRALQRRAALPRLGLHGHPSQSHRRRPARAAALRLPRRRPGFDPTVLGPFAERPALVRRGRQSPRRAPRHDSRQVALRRARFARRPRRARQHDAQVKRSAPGRGTTRRRSLDRHHSTALARPSTD
mmetsp:Transcript_2990/g.8927  ORF Transcript_2990/g.8927 Transcript_2990/m.8927 type:complete len:218 (-) Transcript_2990:1349-2002(-)